MGGGKLLHVDRCQRKILEDGHVGEKVELLEDEAAPQSHLMELAQPFGTRIADADGDSIHLDHPFVRLFKAIDTPQQSRLAAAGRTEEHHGFAPMYVEADVVEHRMPVKAFREVCVS